jgi:hypothetical protein
MRFISRLLAPFVFVIAYALFRSSMQQKSLKKHTFVMKLFRFCADNGHKKALSVYGHLLHFKGDGVQNRIQGCGAALFLATVGVLFVIRLPVKKRLLTDSYCLTQCV